MTDATNDLPAQSGSQPVNSWAPDRHQLAIAILAIATAAIGFGLFGSGLKGNNGSTGAFLPAFIILTLVSYAFVVIATGRILLRNDNPDGRDLIVGPFYWMAIEMTLMALIFLVRLFQSPLTD